MKHRGPPPQMLADAILWAVLLAHLEAPWPAFALMALALGIRYGTEQL